MCKSTSILDTLLDKENLHWKIFKYYCFVRVLTSLLWQFATWDEVGCESQLVGHKS